VSPEGFGAPTGPLAAPNLALHDASVIQTERVTRRAPHARGVPLRPPRGREVPPGVRRHPELQLAHPATPNESGQRTTPGGPERFKSPGPDGDPGLREDPPRRLLQGRSHSPREDRHPLTKQLAQRTVDHLTGANTQHTFTTGIFSARVVDGRWPVYRPHQGRT